MTGTSTFSLKASSETAWVCLFPRNLKSGIFQKESEVPGCKFFSTILVNSDQSRQFQRYLWSINTCCLHRSSALTFDTMLQMHTGSFFVKTVFRNCQVLWIKSICPTPHTLYCPKFWFWALSLVAVYTWVCLLLECAEDYFIQMLDMPNKNETHRKPVLSQLVNTLPWLQWLQYHGVWDLAEHTKGQC